MHSRFVMQDVRPAAVAGMFYPGAPDRLAGEIRSYLSDARAQASRAPKALIVPHAGYVYSGAIAANGYALVGALRESVRRVILLGPAHRVAVGGLATTTARAFETPRGPVRIDSDAVAMALASPRVVVSDAVHAHEHALEVQLPFLQTVLADFSLVPFAVGHASADDVAEVLDTLWGGPETLVVVSSDLSHYHPYAQARRIDRATTDAILAMSPELDHEQACGATPINALLQCAKRRGLSATLLDLRNSGDTAGDRSRVVGYASIAFAGDGDQ
jgi:AmmeMemoRadiSam system protein B